MKVGERVFVRRALFAMAWGLWLIGDCTAEDLDPEAITVQNAQAVLLIIAGDASGTVLQGSGCVVDQAQGLVLTTAHQVSGVSTVRGLTQDNEAFVFTIVNVDSDRDLAVLRTKQPLPDAAELGDPDELNPGAGVVALSSPQGIAFSTHIGYVTNTRYERHGFNVLLTDLPLTGGSSGGPVFNSQGQLIGLVSGRIDDVDNTVVVPVSQARTLLCGAGSILPLCGDGVTEEPTVVIGGAENGEESAAAEVYNRGVRSSDTAEKIASYGQATKLFPGFYEAWYNLGVACAAMGDWPRAVEAYEAARDIRPDAARVRRNLGQALLHAGQPAQGAVEFEEAVRLAPDDERAHNDLGEAYRRLERYDAAAAAFERSLSLRPDFPAAHFNYGLTLVHLGRPSDAVGQFEEYLRAAPEAADASDVRRVINELKTKDRTP
jgi:Tfp pilus assembly protein PilF